MVAKTKESKKGVITVKQKELIEKMGVSLEREGLPPVVSRIIGLLMIADKLELTFEEIYQTLNISKSAASNALNLLLNTHRVEYITKHGDRKRYFRVRIDQWQNMIMGRVHFLSSVSVLYKEIHAQRTSDTKEFNKNLKEFITFIEFLQKEIPLLFQKWKEKKS